MRNKGYKNYVDEEVLEANPWKLIQLLYQGALDSISAARRHLRLGDIRARSRAISKAMAIVTELSLSLNHKEGGEVSRNLEELYGYVQKLLIQANTGQSAPPLEQAECLLSTLLLAWESAAPAEVSSSPGGDPMVQRDYQPVRCAY